MENKKTSEQQMKVHNYMLKKKINLLFCHEIRCIDIKTDSFKYHNLFDRYDRSFSCGLC